MDTLKKFFPFSFTEKKDTASLVITVIVMLAVATVVRYVIGILAIIPIIGLIFGLVGALFGRYVLVSIVLTFLDYFKVMK